MKLYLQNTISKSHLLTLNPKYRLVSPRIKLILVIFFVKGYFCDKKTKKCYPREFSNFIVIMFILVNFWSDWRLMVNNVLVYSKPKLIVAYVLIDFGLLLPADFNFQRQ